MMMINPRWLLEKLFLFYIVNVFAWNKTKFSCYTMGEHLIDNQGFPCWTTPNRLSYWEEFEVNKTNLRIGFSKQDEAQYVKAHMQGNISNEGGFVVIINFWTCKLKGMFFQCHW